MIGATFIIERVEKCSDNSNIFLTFSVINIVVIIRIIEFYGHREMSRNSSITLKCLSIPSDPEDNNYFYTILLLTPLITSALITNHGRNQFNNPIYSKTKHSTNRANNPFQFLFSLFLQSCARFGLFLVLDCLFAGLEERSNILNHHYLFSHFWRRRSSYGDN